MLAPMYQELVPGIRVEFTTSATWEPHASCACGLASILVLTALVAWDHLTAGRGLYRVDLLTQYLPWYTYLGQHLRHGDIVQHGGCWALDLDVA